MHLINNQATRTQEVTGLRENTEYEFQILAFTSVGDGPKSTALSKKTKETGKKEGSIRVSRGDRLGDPGELQRGMSLLELIRVTL